MSPHSGPWFWIPGSRSARPGMTIWSGLGANTAAQLRVLSSSRLTNFALDGTGTALLPFELKVIFKLWRDM